MFGGEGDLGNKSSEGGKEVIALHRQPDVLVEREEGDAAVRNVRT